MSCNNIVIDYKLIVTCVWVEKKPILGFNKKLTNKVSSQIHNEYVSHYSPTNTRDIIELNKLFNYSELTRHASCRY